MEEFKPTFPQFRDDGNGSFAELLKGKSPFAVFFLRTKDLDGEPLDMARLVERLAAQYGSQIRFLWVDSDMDNALHQKLGLNGLPTLVLFSGGRIIAPFVCVSSEPGIRYELDELIHPHQNSDFEYSRILIPVTV